MDFLLTADHDIDVSAKDFTLTSEDDGTAVKQRLLIRLLSFRGEWFTNTDYGVPYYQTIFQKGVTKDVVDTILRREIESVEGVGRIVNFTSTLNLASREYSLSFRVVTTQGVTIEITI